MPYGLFNAKIWFICKCLIIDITLLQFFEEFVGWNNVFVNDNYIRYFIGVCVFKKWNDFVYIPLFVHDYNATVFVGRENDDVQY